MGTTLYLRRTFFFGAASVLSLIGQSFVRLMFEMSGDSRVARGRSVGAGRACRANRRRWFRPLLARLAAVGVGAGIDAGLAQLDATRFGQVGQPRLRIAQQLRAGAILGGEMDVDAVAKVISALGRVLLGTPSIREIDLNPVVVYPRGQGAVALDALILAE